MRLIPLLLLLAMVGPLTLNILQPALPGLAKALDAPRETVQLTLSLYILGMAVAQLVAGPLADRFGRRPVILICLTIYIAASVAAAFALDITMLIAARIAQAIGATACLGLSRTIIADVSDRATTAKIIAYVTMVMVLAPMASPNIGAALDARYGWRAIFVFCALFGVAMLAIAALWLLETRPASLVGATYSAVARRTWALAKNRQFLRYVVLSSFASACFFIFLGATPHLIIEAMGRSPSEFSLWYIILGVGYALGNFTVARFTSWIGADRMMVAGNLLLLVGATAIAGLALVPVRA